MQPGEQSRPESIAGTDGVHDFDLRGVDANAQISMRAERATRAERDDDERDSTVENAFSSALVVVARVKPRQVGVTRLDDGALRDHLEHALAIFGVGSDACSDVRVEHDHALVVLAMHQLDESGRHRLQDQAQRAQMERGDIRAEMLRHQVARQVGSRGALDQELVFGEAFRIDVGHRDRGRLRSEAGQVEAHPVRGQPAAELLTERVFRQAPEEGGGHAETGQGARRVERTSARRRELRAVFVVDHVDQRFAADDYHGRISPEPR